MSKTPKISPLVSPEAPAMTDVARMLGVHHTTVSRALRNDPRISEAVRHRVKEAAEKLGYRPNPLLSVLGTLRRQRAKILHQTPLAYISFGRHTGHLEGMTSTASQRGFKAENFILSENLSASRLNTILLARNIQGIILGPLPEAHGHFDLDWDRFCTVAIEYSFDRPAFDRVVTDSFGTMTLVIDQCRRKGYTSLGVCLAQVVDERNEGLLCASYALARERLPDLRNLPPLILPTWNEKSFITWLKQHQPRVIISSNTLLPGIQDTLRRLELRVPDDIGLVNLNIHEPAGDLAGISQDAPGIATLATRRVIEKIHHNETGIPQSRVTILTESRWRDGKTLPDLK